MIQNLWSDLEEEKERGGGGERNRGWHYVIPFDPSILCRTLNQSIGQPGLFESRRFKVKCLFREICLAIDIFEKGRNWNECFEGLFSNLEIGSWNPNEFNLIFKVSSI